MSVFGSTGAMPAINLHLNGQEGQDLDLNGPHHRMYDEFVAFEEIISGQDYVRAQAALDHSRAVMQVLDQAARTMKAS